MVSADDMDGGGQSEAGRTNTYTQLVDIEPRVCPPDTKHFRGECAQHSRRIKELMQWCERVRSLFDSGVIVKCNLDECFKAQHKRKFRGEDNMQTNLVSIMTQVIAQFECDLKIYEKLTSQTHQLEEACEKQMRLMFARMQFAMTPCVTVDEREKIRTL